MKSFSMHSRIILSVVLVGILTSMLFTNCSKSGFSTQDGGVGVGLLSGGDPFLGYSWQLQNTGQQVFAAASGTAGIDLNLANTWAEGISGHGVKVLISDDGVEDIHEDLNANYLYSNLSKDYTKASPYWANTSAPIDASDNHGTSVAGLIAAVGGNGVGSRGVAPRASIASANFLSANVSQTVANLVDQAGGNFDVYNMSWGGTQNTLVLGDSTYESILRSAVTSNRRGLGSVYIKAAGNDFKVLCHGSSTAYCVGNSNFDGDNTNPFTMVTAAANATGKVSSYSSPGSNLWITAPGGEFGDDTPAMITTDRMGCSKGFSQSSISTDVAFDKGASGNSNCNYTATFNGTSAAAPVMSGVVALLLEANPNLSWRDIRYILAKTATPLDHITNGYIPHPLGTAVPSGYAWDQVWVTNAAGFHFHNWYGFGLANVDAAVAMAKTYTSSFGVFTTTNWAADQAGLAVAIPDNSATGATRTMAVATAYKIEAVQLRIYITHADISQLALELTSPSGTKSVLVNVNNSLVGMPDFLGEVFLSNAFYQENSAGTWTLKVVDGKAGTTGTLTRWSLNFWGNP